VVARGPELVLRHWVNVIRDASLAKSGSGLGLELLCGAVPLTSAATVLVDAR
jgi:hypothetical protein